MRKLKKPIRRKSVKAGDLVEKITKATGIKTIVEWVAGEDCGCKERKERWNEIELFKYKVPSCFTEEEYLYLDKFLERNPPSVTVEEQTELIKIYNRVFKADRRITTCSPCVNQIIHDLNIVFQEYETNN